MSDENPLATDPETEDETAEDEREEAQTWLDKIKAREKVFADGWWKKAEGAVELYAAEKTSSQDPSSSTPYNILYSNTEVLLPSLYSATPKPDVRARYKGTDLKPIPELVERFLIAFSDPASPGHEDLDFSMSETVLESLTAGMGFVRIRYYKDRAIPLCTEAGHYKGLIWGPARKWAKVPWIAFRHELTRDEFFSTFEIPDTPEDRAKLAQIEDGETGEKDKHGSIVVYELWDKSEREITYLCEDWQDLVVKEEEDYLKLDSFFPTPGPLLMTMQPGKLVPVPLYAFYQNQAEELNRVTVRLNKVLSALKVRGAYNSLLGEDLKTILQDTEMENALIPAKEAGMLAQNGGFDRQIWLLPIEKLVVVAQQLYQARQQIKQVIYELTGISDIIRGSSVASETATAQDLKNKWGTIRLRKMQTAVANYVRDLYRLTIDAATSVVPPEQWLKITQLQIPNAQQKMQAQAQLQQLAQQAIMAQQQGQQPQPPDPQLMATVKGPSIEEAVQQIADDANRTFLINVQSNSTVDLDTAQDKQEVGEFMNAMGQLLAGLQPLASLGPTGLQAAQSILVAVCERYKFGLQIVDSIKAIQPPPPPQNDSPELQKKAKELDSREQQIQQAAEGLDQQHQQLKDMQAKLQDTLRAIEVARKEFEAQQKVAAAEHQAREQVFNANRAQRNAEAAAQHAQRETKLVASTAQQKEKAAQTVLQQNQATQPDLRPIVEAVAQMQQALAKLGDVVSQLAQKPKRLVKSPDGAWTPEY